MTEFYSKLQLQGRHSSQEPWGIYNTLLIDNTDEKGLKKANKQIDQLKSGWHENYDPLIEFRVVKL